MSTTTIPQVSGEPNEETQDVDLSALWVPDRVRAIIFEQIDDELSVYSAMRRMERVCPELDRLEIAQIVQVMIDDHEICIVLNEEDWPAFYRWIPDGDSDETDVEYLSAMDAFNESERRWNMAHGERSETELNLLEILQTVSFGGVVRIHELAIALQEQGWTVSEAWPALELLADRGEVTFEEQPHAGEVFIILEDAKSFALLRHKALPLVRAMLEAGCASQIQPQRQPGGPSSFILSKSLEHVGYSLTDCERVIVDVCQRLNRRFMRGTPVAVPIVRRVAKQYHQIRRRDVNVAICGLMNRGVLRKSLSDSLAEQIHCIPRFRGHNEVSSPETAGIGPLVVKGEPWRNGRLAAATVQPESPVLNGGESVGSWETCSVNWESVVEMLTTAGIPHTLFHQSLVICGPSAE